MNSLIWLSCVILLTYTVSGIEGICGYEGCPATNPDLINVHLVPHSHDDVGWLKTVDQYYYGSRTDIQSAGVQYILDSVIEELLEDPERRFIYVESAFFFQWWVEQSDRVKNDVFQLINEGRLEFIGGAWSMNDEATTHYQSNIDQFTWGLRLLNDTFGECGRPRIGWQIDPFGHSREMASLFAQMGYDGLFFARLDYQDKDNRLLNQEAEFIWHGSPLNLGKDADIFTGIFYYHYLAPPGFCFDLMCNDEPLVEDINNPEYNIERKVDEFLDFVDRFYGYYRTNQVIITMGQDFSYQAANTWFVNMDILMRHANQRQETGSKFNLFYSTPSCYLKSLHDAGIEWPSTTDDFFPYSSDPHAFWTGYFTSRPTLKRYEREGAHLLQICKQMSVNAPEREESFEPNLTRLREAIGIMQHHDAQTGTSKQHVADDYGRIISEGCEACDNNVRNVLNQLTQRDDDWQANFEFSNCWGKNISMCEVTENTDSFMVTVYNPLGQATNQYVRVPIQQRTGYEVYDNQFNLLVSQAVPVPNEILQLPFRKSNIFSELIFWAENLPPMGYRTYLVRRNSNLREFVVPQPITPQRDPDAIVDLIVGNSKVNLRFKNGRLAEIERDGVRNRLEQEFLYYEAAVGDNYAFENRSSGAYIFRPNGTARHFDDVVYIQTYSGPHVVEIHQTVNGWISQVIRLYERENFIEFEWLVGPIPIDDDNGREIISLFTTDIESNEEFYTDSSGRESIKRIRDFRETWDLELEEPIAGNYYPVIAKIAIEDSNYRLAVLNDRAQGGSSIIDGTIELMVHRRLLHDDAFGVEEALNETAFGQGLIARGKHYVLFGSPQRTQSPSLVAEERFLQLRALLPGATFFSTATGFSPAHLINNFNTMHSGMAKSLPQNVHLLTFELWKNESILIRFEHIMERNDDIEYSRPVTFNIQDLFDSFEILSIRETVLGANQWLDESERFVFEEENVVKVAAVDEEIVTTVDEAELSISLEPMQIKTFVITVNWRVDNRANERTCGYEGCSRIKENMLNVHIVPHTHDDVGWLKTVEQYYYGSRTNIQRAGVQYILDTVIQELLLNPNRRFIYVESAFFFFWWDLQTETTKEQVKMLVNEGRLEFIGGAWSMNDEATTHYHSVIDQFTWGLKNLNDTFGECGRPKVGWQIDPFGHSRETASMLAQMGYDGVFFSRLDHQDRNDRLLDRRGEMIWQGSESLGAESHLLAGVLYWHYSPPPGLCFDVLCQDDPMIDDVNSPNYNIDSKVEDFFDFLRNMANYYRTNNLIITMGDDFHYQAANMWFTNLDILIRRVNERQAQGTDINIFYSTPSCYVKSLQDANITFPTKTDDFFPYSSDWHAFWTGYFTSRPTLKRYEREGSNLLQVCKQLTALAPTKKEGFLPNLNKLREIIGIMQHHDAITGTEKQHVADDYSRLLSDGFASCGENAREVLNQIVNPLIVNPSYDFEFDTCLTLNISQCVISENSDQFLVTVYNSLSHRSYQYVRLPVPDLFYEVLDNLGETVQTQIVPVPDAVKRIPHRQGEANFELIFLADELPPLGYESFFVRRTAGRTSNIQSVPRRDDAIIEVTIANEHLRASFDSNGLLAAIEVNGQQSRLEQNFWWYEGYYGDNSQQERRASGAYVFRPVGNAQLVAPRADIQVYSGPLVDEVHQIFSPWVSQVIRLYRHDKHLEFEWLVGAIPIDGSIGKEIITRFNTDIQSGGQFYTDTSGRESIRRYRNFRQTWNIDLREPISGNYYPVVAKIAIEDSNNRLAILNDRAQGGSSLRDGEVELMVHRRLLRDDGFGVGEALNEVQYGIGLIARGKHFLKFGPFIQSSSPTLRAEERFLQEQALLPSWVFLSDVSDLSFANWQANFLNKISAITSPLPENVHIMTLEPWNENTVLIRFEHLLEHNDDPELSRPVSFNIKNLFTSYEITGIRETMLAGNQWKNESKRFVFQRDDGNRENIVEDNDKPRDAEEEYEITLAAMQIRTFILEIAPITVIVPV